MDTSTIYAISYSRYGNKHWNRYQDYLFAKAQNVAPLASEEIAKAAVAMPIGFIELNDETIPVALLGLEAQRNAMVSIQGGWEGHYVPAVLRSYPFLLAKDTNGHEQVLCFDESSGLLSDHVGEAFYLAPDQPAEFLTKVLDFLGKVHLGQHSARQAASVLRDHGILEPWDISFNSDEGDKDFKGLYRVNEAKLTHLSDTDFIALRSHGALALAYAQLVSTMHLPSLIRHVQTKIHARLSAQQAMSDIDFNNINFDDFKL